MNSHIGDKIFQNTPRRAAKFRENRPRDVEKYVARKKIKLCCGPMPNVMVALPNIGGALCSMPQSLANGHYLTVVHTMCGSMVDIQSPATVIRRGKKDSNHRAKI